MTWSVFFRENYWCRKGYRSQKTDDAIPCYRHAQCSFSLKFGAVAGPAYRDDQRLPSSFSAGFRHRRHFIRAGAGRSGGKRDETLVAVGTFLLCCYATATKWLYRSILFASQQTFYHNIAQIKKHPSRICGKGASFCQGNFSLGGRALVLSPRPPVSARFLPDDCEQRPSLPA